jgi:hypothetical protein
MKEIYLYVPAIFDASKFSELSGFEDEAHWFLHKIITAASHRKHEYLFDGMAHISRKTMETFIHPSKVKRVRNALINHGVVVVNDSYKISDFVRGITGYSQRYGLSEPYAGDFRRIVVMKKALGAKILKHRITVAHKPVDPLDMDHTLDYLLGWLRKLKIDIHAAYELIDQETSEQPRVTTARVGKRGRRKIVKVALPDPKAINRMTAETIHNQEWEFKQCPIGRLHTNVTRLLTSSRSCLSIAGQPLISADIANSQLLFFLILLLDHRLNQSISSDSSSIPYSSPTQSPNPPSSANPTSSSPSTTTHSSLSNPSFPQLPPSTTPAPSHSLRTTSIGAQKEGWMGNENEGSDHQRYDAYLKDDEIEFKQRVMNGTIYDHLMGMTGYSSRGKFKKDFFQGVLYGDNTANYSKVNKITHAFRATYPTVWEFILESKVGGFEQLARDMQTRESRLVIGQVCGRLALHHPDIPVITIHDSLMTIPEHVPTVVRIMEEEFLRIGLTPKIKVDAPPVLKAA